MDNVKDDIYFKEKVISDINFILENMKHVEKEELIQDQILLDSMTFRLIQISENSSHFTDKFKEQHSEIQWDLIKALRNRLVHDYGNINYDVVYDTLKNDISELKGQLEKE